jgi:hypothetical protein
MIFPFQVWIAAQVMVWACFFPYAPKKAKPEAKND